MKKIHSSHYILLMCAILTIVTVSFGYYFIYQRSITQARNAEEAQREVVIETDKKKHEQELLKLYADTAEDRELIASYVVPGDGIVDLIEKIEHIGAESGTDFELSGISSDDLSAAAKGKIGHIRAHIETQGPWENVMRALMLIENLPYSVSINNVEISSSDAFVKVNDAKAVKSRIWNLTFNMEVLMVK